MSAALKVTNLTKHYGEYLAVDRISFEIQPGEILGLLGPNGAGKSTTIQMLLGLTEPDAGQIEYFGQDFSTHREASLDRLNFASAYNVLQGRMTVYQNLRIFAGLYRVADWKSRIKELSALLEIEDLLHTLFWKLSSGQKTRAILAKALLNRPKLLLMDEPTASLDPDIIDKLIELIKDLQAKEKLAILYTSHNMEEVSRVCDRVAFLAHGKIVAIDSPLELAKKVGSVTLSLHFVGSQPKVKEYLTRKKHHFEFKATNHLEVYVEEDQVPAVLFGLKDLDIFVEQIQIRQPSLEDVFLHVARNKHV